MWMTLWMSSAADSVHGWPFDLETNKQNKYYLTNVSTPTTIILLLHSTGCKIKALRAKTNTYIKTPVRGEEPVFLITGRKEDVALARREIISAAEHFSMLRASRNKLGVSFNGSPPAPLPGQTTIQVRVPYRVVGLVVGPKGSTIKRIQQQTCTYIVTPSRDRDPVFEITGSPGNAERAREEIESHIAFRTGGLHDHNNENDCLGPDSGNGGLESRLQQVWGLQGAPRKPLTSSYRQNFSDAMVGSSSGGGIYSKGDFTNHSNGDKPCSYFGSEGTQSWGRSRLSQTGGLLCPAALQKLWRPASSSDQTVAGTAWTVRHRKLQRRGVSSCPGAPCPQRAHRHHCHVHRTSPRAGFSTCHGSGMHDLFWEQSDRRSGPVWS